MTQGVPHVKTDKIEQDKENQIRHTFLPLPDGDSVHWVQADREEQLASGTEAD